MKNGKAKKLLGVALASALGLLTITTGAGCGPNPPDGGTVDNRNLTAQQYSYSNAMGVDDYGRKVTVRNVADDKETYVGVFYSLWLGSHMDGYGGNVYDVDKLEKENPSALYANSKNPNPASPVGRYHFGSEPLYGYYSMRDPWVVTRHVELLSMAGIDYLMIDATNAWIYEDAGHVLCNTLIKYQNQGWKVPKVAFYTNTNSKLTITKLQNEYYFAHREYDSIWFRMKHDPRPVIVGVSENNLVYNIYTGEEKYSCDFVGQYDNVVVKLDSDMYNYFNFFESQWPTNVVATNEDYGLPWMSQWDAAPIAFENGNIATSVNKHSSDSTFSSSKFNVSSRGYNGGDNRSPDGKDADWKKGSNLEWQLNSARKWIDKGYATNLLITGWNEWIAVKMDTEYVKRSNPSFSWETDPNTGNPVFFVDCYNAEYSRDMEMGKAYGDGFYMQLLRHAREIKNGDAIKYKMPTKTISDLTDFTLWNDVKTVYADFVGDALARNGESAAKKQNAYIDNTNRNDIASIKVVCDAKNVYFLVETNEDITAYNAGDKYWMNLMISTGKDSNNAFMGFDYIINRSPNGDGTTSIERCLAANAYAWADTGYSAEYYVEGNKIAYKIPLSALGITGDASFTFKVTDNVAKPATRTENGVVITETNFDPDKMDFYIYGDSAPLGTLGYAYNKGTKA